MSKKKLFYYGDSPLTATGMGNVSSHILSALQATDEYEITMVAINHNYPIALSPTLSKVYPYEIYRASDSGEPMGVEMVKQILPQVEWDYVILNNDPQILLQFSEVLKKTSGKKISYFPVDTIYNGRVHPEVAKQFDKAVLFTEYARDLMLKDNPELSDKLDVIYHGVDTDVFKRIGDNHRSKVREQVFKCKNDDFLVLNVNRNQWRKDFFRTIYAFLLFYKEHKNAKLHLHCKPNDMGGDLFHQIASIIQWFGLDYNEVIKENHAILLESDNLNTNTGVPVELLAQEYGCADVFVSTTQGEGWGLTTTEAMSCKVPVIVPRNTSQIEIVGENEERGYLVDSGSNANLFTMNYGQSDTVRPLVDVEHLVEKLEYVYNNRREAELKAVKARKWCEANSWKVQGEKWVKLLGSLQCQ